MEVQYAPEVRQPADRLVLLQDASDRLIKIAPPSAKLAKVEWTQTTNHRGQPIYHLTIRDDPEEATTEFTVEQLRNPLHMQYRVAELWGDLLQIRSDRVHAIAQKLVGELLAESETVAHGHQD